MNAPIERLGGAVNGMWMSAHQVVAYHSLARSRGVEFAKVAEAAADGRLRDIVEMRDIGRECRVVEQNVIRIRNLYRLRVLSILQDGNY
jgi:hypothetical protein